MDTPQLEAATLAGAAATLAAPGTDAVLGPGDDGGYWAIGLRRPDPRAFEGVPMSTERTCREQRRRLAGLGMRVHGLPRMRDVDTFDDADAVARLCPDSRFANAVARLRAPASGS